ncbi:MAG TPA: hypothetical protein VFK10_01455 [Burkholderiaceae bacterium]|nr:hypothetical protein [Burkholderiaceae bacterium]
MAQEISRRSLLLTLGASASGCSLPTQEVVDIDTLGTFERVPGRPGIVIGVPHGTADVGTADIGRFLCQRLGASGVFVIGFWDGKTRQRINVNRPTEQIIGPQSQVVREWSSDRAAAANARYVAAVKEAAGGSLLAFYEIHSNRHAEYVGSIEVSTLGVDTAEAARFKDAFTSAIERLPSEAPKLAVHVSPIDRVGYPNYGYASSIAKFSNKGCVLEHPAAATNRAWRLAYARCLAEAIEAARWDA